MTNRAIVVSVLGVHLLFVVLYIHKSSRLVQESYLMQHNEIVCKRLEHEKQELGYKLSAVQSRSAIQNFAQDVLGMRPITLKQINKLVI